MNKRPSAKKFEASQKRPHAKSIAPKKICRYGAMNREEYPCWHFGLIDWEGPFASTPCEWESVTLKDLIDALKPFECSKWSDILTQQSRGNPRHSFIACENTCRDAQTRLAAIKQDDVDELFKFRLMGKVRCYGIVDRHIFKILWWDCDHQVYPMNIADN